MGILRRALYGCNPASWSGMPQDHPAKMEFCWAVLRSFCLADHNVLHLRFTWIMEVWFRSCSFLFMADFLRSMLIFQAVFSFWASTSQPNPPFRGVFQNSQVPASMDKLCKYATPLTVSKKKSAARGSFTIPTSSCDSWVVTETFLYLL